MKTQFTLFVMIPLILAGCSPKANQPAEQPKDEPVAQTEPETQEAKPDVNEAAPEEGKLPAETAKEAESDAETAKDAGTNKELRPFKFTVDLDQYYEQRVCNEDTGQCKSYKDLKSDPEIVIHVVEVPDAIVKYDIDCDGDGQFELEGITGSTACKYSTKTGKYQIAIRGDIPGIMLCGDSEDEPEFDFSNQKAVLSVDQWGDIRWKTMQRFAANCLNIQLPAKEAPVLTDVTDMSHIFQGAINFNQSIEHWDVSHVTNLSYAFIAAFAYNKPLNRWNTSSVTDMSYTFMLCRTFNQPLDKWDVSHVKDMSGMFTEANAFNQPIADWDVSNVTNMDGMFRGASSFNQPIGSWNVAHVTNMQGMFNRATAFNQPLEQWDVAGVRTMNAMFWGATGFKQNIDAWNVSPSRDTHSMFQDSGRKDLPKWYRE